MVTVFNNTITLVRGDTVEVPVTIRLRNGEDVDLDQLIEECNTKITGCTAKELVDAGRLHELNLKAYKTDLDGILSADRPAIIWWKYSHWCVYCGLNDEGKVVICNPDRGRYSMSKGIFKMFYTDVALFNGEPQDLPA